MSGVLSFGLLGPIINAMQGKSDPGPLGMNQGLLGMALNTMNGQQSGSPAMPAMPQTPQTAPPPMTPAASLLPPGPLADQLAAGQAAGAAMRAPPPQGPAPATGTLPWALAQGNALDQSQYGGLYSNLSNPSRGQLAAGMSGQFPSFNDPRLVADRLATAAQDSSLTDDERQKASDAFFRYMSGGGGGGGYGGGQGGSGSSAAGGGQTSGGGATASGGPGSW